ncbi:Uncharacterized membrane protein, DUF2157 family [Halalkaliarchaeum sp. AArc-CO]|uniref:DUF2157 domain-containing protein n=1 Tax=unclassified Halalkaliarchaeum TaxID=2678344 RepID=UPI00217EFFEE|nr:MULTISPECIES: DUF2157 domain-containing protein [unclassified Halalkaliarchaeum]MDR5674614.1 DUF2157 domain-containing protein [Halalkaliarchaeum sp. AArc-GB]UWG52176.1 Uncharacterized membrane protein, DUF2157 family [Halalkaliarchaeum sp. AArc-CO]
MDPDDLRGEVVDWVEEGLISPDQARRILDRYDVDPPEPLQEPSGAERSRTVTAIALMGGLLVAAGIGLYVATAWENIPRLLRAGILLVVPAVGFLGSLRLVARQRPRVGHGIWFASAAFVGATVFLLSDLYTLDVESAWLFLVWAGVAIAAGHAYPSRPTTALGLLLSGALVVDVADGLGVDPVFPVGALGVFLFVVGANRLDAFALEAGTADSGVDAIYRLVGFGFAVLGVLAIAASSSVGSFPDPGGTLMALLFAVAAVATVGVGWRLYGAGISPSSSRGTAALWAAGVLLVLGFGTVFVQYATGLPELVGVFGTHALSLAVLVGGVVVGYRTDARGIVNVVALAFLLQLLFFLEATIAGVLPQSLALVIAGIVLLSAAFGLERGRRRLFARMNR